MQAIHFGAGSIGRGFIGDLLHETGYEITFVENNASLNTQITQNKGYEIYLIEHDYERKFIPVADAFSPLTQKKQIIQKIVDADLISTAVWADNLRHIAPLIWEGLQARQAQGKSRINIIVCENALFNGELLKQEIIALGAQNPDAFAAFPSTAVDRMVLVSSRNGQQSIDSGVEYELVIDKTKLVDVDSQPVKGAIYSNNLKIYLERKLYIINGGHAWAGYVGKLKGYVTMQQVFADSQLVSAIRQVMQETARLLAKKYAFSFEELNRYIDFVINRFSTPGVVDTINRVCRSPIRKLAREERLTGPCLQCAEYGLENDALITGIAAALLYYDVSDAQSVELRDYIFRHGISQAIPHFTGIEAGSDLYNRVIDRYRALTPQ